jgi:hypothetical protein
MQIWLFALAGAVAPAPAEQVLAASQSSKAATDTATVTPAAPAVEATAATASVTPAGPAVEKTAATASAPRKPLILDPPAKAGNVVPKKPVVLDPPANSVAFTAPKKPALWDPPAKNKGVVLAAPKKPVIFSPPREATGWKAAQEEAAKAPVVLKSTENSAVITPLTENSTGEPTVATASAPEKPVVLDPPANGVAFTAPKKPVLWDPPAAFSAENSTGVALSTENSTAGAALAAEDPPQTDHEIHDMIHEAHKTMCEDGRMDSSHCEKFRNTLDEMHEQIETMHDDHNAQMVDSTADASADEAAGASNGTAPETGAVEYTTEVEAVKEHEPVIKRHEYPYKTGPCAGATAVALLFSGLLFA